MTRRDRQSYSGSNATPPTLLRYCQYGCRQTEKPIPDRWLDSKPTASKLSRVPRARVERNTHHSLNGIRIAQSVATRTARVSGVNARGDAVEFCPCGNGITLEFFYKIRNDPAGNALDALAAEEPDDFTSYVTRAAGVLGTN